ncbi:ABC transporter substrate-binding protein [Nonomuraea sp. NPDC003804]|uniref:ABC transporter substrate-binding protein n=1 Tax=Nonomuraea sp. NPDC003804 TaxID=3154547 RepID=UPI0033AA52EE
MSVSRRGLLAAAAGLGAALALAACGGESASAPAAPAQASAAAAPFTYTDDRGRKIDLPKTPARIVAQVGSAAALWDFGVKPIAVFGPHKLSNGERDPQVGNVDITKVTGLGNVWDEFNVEQYIGLQPELLVSSMYLKDTLWYVPEKSKDTIEKVAPTAGVMLTGRNATEVIAKYGDLAAKLGADLAALDITQAKARYEAALEALRKLAAKGLTIELVSGSPDAMYVSTPEMVPDFKLLSDAGLDIVKPKVDAQGYFESLSWENADKYEADVILFDSRTQALGLEEMKKKPTFAKLPAVAKGQVYPMWVETPYSYQKWADLLEGLVADLGKASKLP